MLPLQTTCAFSVAMGMEVGSATGGDKILFVGGLIPAGLDSEEPAAFPGMGLARFGFSDVFHYFLRLLQRSAQTVKDEAREFIRLEFQCCEFSPRRIVWPFR